MSCSSIDSSTTSSSRHQDLLLLKVLKPGVNIKKKRYVDKTKKHIQSLSLEWNCIITRHHNNHSFGDVNCTEIIETELDYDEEKKAIEVCYVDVIKRREDEAANYLKRFQEALSRMTKIQSLHLLRFPFRHIPFGVGDMTTLQSLEIEHCDNLEYLPTSICCLKNLKLLVIQGCDNLRALPREIENLDCLKILLIIECHRIESLPTEIENLKTLEFLQIKNNHSLLTIPRLPKNLDMLEIYGIPLLSSLIPTELERLQKLKMLNLVSLPSLTMLPQGFGSSFPELQHLEVSCCPRIVNFDDVALPRLKCVRLSYMDDLQYISSSVKRLPNLDCMELSGLSPSVLIDFFSGKWCSSSDSLSPKTIRLRGFFHKNIDRRLRDAYPQILPALPQSLIKLDLENQGIDSLDGFLNGGLPAGIRKLNLHGNAILKSAGTKDQDDLEKLLTSYPSLGWIGRDQNLYHLSPSSSSQINEFLSRTAKDQQDSKKNENTRYYTLFTASTTHMLLLNRCGRTLIQEDPTNRNRRSLPLSVWPMVLAWVRNELRKSNTNSKFSGASSANRSSSSSFSNNVHGIGGSMECSVIFSLLQGPALLSRPREV